MKTFLPLTTLLLLLVSFANGQPVCSDATLEGAYGLHSTGATPAGEFAAVGRFTFDGRGNLTGQLFVRSAGNTVQPPPFTGTYSISSDCIMTDTWGPPINSTHTSMIVDGGRGYFLVVTTPGTPETISAEARKIFPGRR